jgi:flagellar biogenesis protein FliO
MDGIKIVSAIFLVAMLVYLFPRMKSALKDSPKGEAEDWMGLLPPLLGLIGFVMLLVYLV